MHEDKHAARSDVFLEEGKYTSPALVSHCLSLCKSVILALAMSHIAAKKSMRVVIMATIVQVRVCVCVSNSSMVSFLCQAARQAARQAGNPLGDLLLDFSLVVYSSVTDLRCAIGFH